MKANLKKEVKEKNEEEAFKMLPNNIKQFFKEIDFNKEPDGNVRVKFMAVVPEANSFEIFLEVLDTFPRRSNIFKYFARLHRALIHESEEYRKRFEELEKMLWDKYPSFTMSIPPHQAMQYSI